MRSGEATHSPAAPRVLTRSGGVQLRPERAASSPNLIGGLDRAGRTLIAAADVYEGSAFARQGPVRRPGLPRMDRHRAGHDDDRTWSSRLPPGPASRIWFASAAIRYRMLAAGLVSSAVGWPCLAGSALGLSIGFRQRPRQHGGRQVEAMNLLITAATLAGCSSATQCPLSAMMLVATCRLPASPRPAATSGNTVA